jgi:hypothetical protein
VGNVINFNLRYKGNWKEDKKHGICAKIFRQDGRLYKEIGEWMND